MGQATSLKDVSYMSMTVVLLMEEFQDNVNSQIGICHVTLMQLQFGQITSTFLKVKKLGCGIITKNN